MDREHDTGYIKQEIIRLAGMLPKDALDGLVVRMSGMVSYSKPDTPEEMVTYNDIPDRPPISENEFVHILLKKGAVSYHGINRKMCVPEKFAGYIIRYDNRLLYNKERFGELLKKIGLVCDRMF